MKRIFIGIKIRQLQSEAEAFRNKNSRLPVRWIASENLHLTLLPPWEASDNEIEEMKNVLVNTNFVHPFDVEFAKITYGPNQREPRLIWAEGRAPEEIFALTEKLEEVLGRRNARPFLLHLTLARFRPENFSSFPVKDLNEEILWKERVVSFQLFESILLPEGARYDILENFKL